MAEINENEIKRRLKVISELKFKPEITARDLQRIRQILTSQAVDEHETKQPNIWRIIMKSKISIPLPVAAGFLIVFCLQFVLQFTGLTSRFKEPEEIKQAKQTVTTVKVPEQSTKTFYSEHNVYVAGIGFIEKSKSYDSF